MPENQDVFLKDLKDILDHYGHLLVYVGGDLDVDEERMRYIMFRITYLGGK